MGITRYGLWIFFETEIDAKRTAKELNSFGNPYMVLIIDKLKILKSHSIKFYLSNLNVVEGISWRFNNTKYVMIDRNTRKGWDLDNWKDEYEEEAKDMLKIVRAESKDIVGKKIEEVLK